MQRKLLQNDFSPNGSDYKIERNLAEVKIVTQINGTFRSVNERFCARSAMSKVAHQLTTCAHLAMPKSTYSSFILIGPCANQPLASKVFSSPRSKFYFLYHFLIILSKNAHACEIL